MRRKGIPSCVTSSSICFTPITLETSRQVANGGDRHHDGVCQEIKEIQELHADQLDAGERTIAERGKASEDQQ